MTESRPIVKRTNKLVILQFFKVVKGIQDVFRNVFRNVFRYGK